MTFILDGLYLLPNFFIFGHTPQHVGSSLTRDQTHALCSGSTVSLTTGPPGKSPACIS